MRYAGFAVVITSLLVCRETMAERQLPGRPFPTNRQLMSASELVEQDKLYSKMCPKTYLNGPRRQTLQPITGKRLLTLPESGLIFNGDDCTSLGQSCRYAEKTLTPAQENVTGRLGNTDFTVRVDCEPQAYHFDFVCRLVGDSRVFPYITVEAHDRIDSAYKTELAAADAIFNLKRADVFDGSKPPNAENMAWILAGPLDLATTRDDLTRYEIGDLVYYLTDSFTQVGVPDVIKLYGHVFNARTGQWVGTILIRGNEKDQGSLARQDVEAILCRLSPKS